MDSKPWGCILVAALGSGAGACTSFQSELDAPGYDVEVVAEDLAYPDGLGRLQSGALVVTEEIRGGGVVRIDPMGGRSYLARDLADPDNIVVLGADVYVTEEDPAGRIVKIDGLLHVSTFASGLTKPEGLDLGPDGSLYVAEHTTAGHIYRFAMDGTRETFAPVTNGEGIRCLGDGSVVVAETTHGRVVRIYPDGDRVRITDEPMDEPDGVLYDPAGNRVMVAEDAAPGRLLSIDLATREAIVIATGLDKPQTMLIEPDGSILLAEQGESRIVRLTPSGPAQEGLLP